MKRKFTRLLFSAVLMMCCTVGAWAGLGTPPDNEIWYTSRDGNVIDPYDKNVFGATYQSNSYNDGKGVIKFNGPVTKVGDIFVVVNQFGKVAAVKIVDITKKNDNSQTVIFEYRIYDDMTLNN